MKTEDITTFYSDYTDDMGNTIEYRWNARWTAKSLIITPALNDDGIPYGYRDNRYIVKRAKAEKHLAEYGFVSSPKYYNAFYPTDSIARQIEYEQKLEADPAYQAQQRKQREHEEEYSSIPESRKELYQLIADKEDFRFMYEMFPLFDKIIEANGGEEIYMAKLTGQNYRSIDA